MSCTAAELPAGERVAVIRFSAMGDAAVAAAAIAALAHARPDLQLTVLTKRLYAPLFTAHAADVWCLEEAANIAVLARRLRRMRPALVLDLHRTLRSHLLRLQTPGLTWRRVRKDRLAKQWRIVRKRGAPIRPIVLRFAELTGIVPHARAWLPQPITRLPHRLVLAPGAAWPTKRWPLSHFMQVARAWSADDGELVWLGGPADGDALHAAAKSTGGRVVVADDLQISLETLATAGLALANDSGAAHLAAAVGTPVAVLYGPTLSAFGYRPWGRHAVLETALDCRPCSVYGSNRCPLGHHRCLTEIPPARALAALRHLRTWPPNESELFA